MPLPRQRWMPPPRNTCATNMRSSAWGRRPIPAARARRPARSAAWAVRNAILDAGLKASDIDGMLSYSGGNSTSATVHRRRSRHPPQFLHGRGRRRLVDRGADRHRDRPDRGRLLQDGGDLPLDERLFAGADRRHRRALGGAGRRRRAAQPRLWLAERRAELRARPSCATCTITAPSRSRSRMVKVAHSHHASNNPKAYYKKRFTVDDVLSSRIHLQAAAPARLLRRDRQRDLRSSSPRPSAPAT